MKGTKTKLMCVLLAIFILLPSCKTVSGGTEGEKAVNRYATGRLDERHYELPSGVVDLDVYGGVAYYTLGGSIMSLTLDGGGEGELAATEGTLGGIFASSDGVYTYDETSNAVLLFNYEGVETGAFPLTVEPFECAHIAVKDNYIVLTAEKKVYLHDIAAAVTEGLKISGYIYSAAFGKDSLYIGTVQNADMTGGEARVLKYSISEGEITDRFSCGDGSFDYDAVNDKLWYTDQFTLKNRDPSSEGSSVSLKELPEERMYFLPDKIMYTTDNLLIWSELGGLEIMNAVFDTPVVTLLTYNGVGEVVQSLAGVTGEYGFNMSVRTYDESEYYDRLSAKLLAGDDDFDVYYLDYNRGDTLLASILRYRLYEPLEGYENVAGCFDAMREGVAGMFTYNGDIYALPWYFGMYSFIVSKADAGYTEGISTGWTFDDMWSLCDSLIGSGRQLFERGIEPMSFLLSAYAEANFDIVNGKPKEGAYENLLDMFEKLKYYREAGAFSGDNPILCSAYGTSGLGKTEDIGGIFAMPCYNADTKATVRVDRMYLINPNSPDKEAAAALIAMLGEPDMSRFGYVRSELLYKNYADFTYMGGDIISADGSRTVQTIAPYSDIDENTRFFLDTLPSLYGAYTAAMYFPSGDMIVKMWDTFYKDFPAESAAYAYSDMTPAEAADEIYRELTYRLCE